MVAVELLKEWPSWQKANAETVLASAAWRLPVEWGGAPAMLTRVADAGVDTLDLAVTFDDEPHVLRVADSAAFADLHRLWARRRELPPEIVLALAEQECGSLFQMLEDALRRQFAVKGLAEAGDAAAEPTAFRLASDDAELTFALDLSPVLKAELGRLENLDVAHETIRSMTRTGEADYGAVALDATACAALAVGDCVLLPETGTATWVFAASDEGDCRLRGAEPAEFTFAQIVDDALPSEPEPAALRLVRGRRTLATGSVVKIGLGAAMRIEDVCEKEGQKNHDDV